MSQKSRMKDRRAAAEVAPASGTILAGNEWVLVLLLSVAVLLAYQRVWRAGFIWDDNGHVTRPDLRSLGGLWRIWFEPGATQQYYPVLHSAFWLEHRLWGDSALGYHLANVLLHLGVVLLLYRVLRRLAMPGALLGAALFALHPVAVESVAWISEQKNTLSGVFYLAAALAYLRFDENRRRSWYGLAVFLFALALLSKTVTATLPAALLVAFWWRRGRLALKADVLPVLPLFGLAAAAGGMTTWMERTFIGASGASFGLTLADRLLVAGRALWFYLGKVFWPADLIFIYPHWNVDGRVPWQWFFPLAAALVMGLLFALRRRHRGPLAAALLFAGTLFPALGFVDVYPFIYSYVADHFQYLAAAMLLAALAAGLTLAVRRLSPGERLAAQGASLGVLALLAVLTWRQTAMYADTESLWLATLARNPDCWMADNNLGTDLADEGKGDEAIAHFERSLALNPGFAETHNNLGIALVRQDRLEDAISQFRTSLQLKPGDVMAHNNLGNALIRAGRRGEAAAVFQQAVAIEPRDLEAEVNLGYLARLGGRPDEALAHYRRAAEIDPASLQARNNLGNAYLGAGRLDEAVAEYGKALAIDPASAETHGNLGAVLLKQGNLEGAIAQLERALELNPGNANAHFNLGNADLQAGRLDEAIAQLKKSLEINPNDAEAHRRLSVALFKKGRVDEAITHYDEANRLR
jgi:tetratricopeptide (TPR) repeat protein